MRWTLAILLSLLLAAVAEGQPRTETGPSEEDAAWLRRQTELLGAGELSQAREQALAQLRRYEARGDLQGQAACSTLIAGTELGMNRREEATAHFEAALSLLERAGDRFAAAGVARALGRLRADEGRFQESEHLFGRALGWIQELREDGRLGSLSWYAVFHAFLDLPYEPPSQWANDPAAVAKALSHSEAVLRGSLGETLFWAGRPEEAEEHFLQALELAAEPGEVVHSLFYLGMIRQAQGRFADARKSYESGLDVMGGSHCRTPDSVDTRRHCFLVLHQLSALSVTEGKPEEALSWIDEARSAAERWGNPMLEAMALRQRASILRVQGRHREARNALEAAGKIVPVTSDPSAEVHRWIGLAFIDLAAGAYERALMHLEMASSLLQEDKPQCSDVMPVALLSVVYWKLGARGLVEKGLARITEAAGQITCSEGGAIVRIVERLIREEPDEAKFGEVLEQLRSLSRQSPVAFSNAGFINDSVELLQGLIDDGNLDEAERLVVPALRAAIERRQPGQELPLRVLRGWIADQRQDFEKASQEWEAALGTARQLEDPNWEALVLAQLGRLRWQMGEREEGLAAVRQSVEKIEALAAGFEVDPLLVSFLGEQTFPFNLLVEMLFEAGRPEEAFAATERARAQALTRLLRGSRPRALAGAPPELLAEARRLRSKMRALEDQIAEGGSRDRLGEDLRGARRSYEELLVRAQLAAQGTRETAGSRDGAPAASAGEPAEWTAPLGIAEVQRLLPPDTTLVSFFADSSRVLAWVVDRHGVESRVTGMAQADLADRVRRFREAIAGEAGRPLPSSESPSRGAVAVGDVPGGLKADWRKQRIALGAELYRKLIAPLKPFLGHRRLILVPHDALHYLPFAALQDPESGRFLLEDDSLTYAPSATALQFLGMASRPFADDSAVVLGDPVASDPTLPRLEGARAEAVAVAKLVDVAPLVGTAASEGRLRELSSEAAILHLAAHGVYAAEHPLFSHLALTPDEEHDGRLEVTEVFEELNLSRGPLVVLSACQTALGEHTGGDEVVGLVRAFLAAGSPAVMATLWEIDDESSAALMRDFYRRLLDGEPAADALRKAQLGILRHRFAAPFFWAAFGLTGGLPNPTVSVGGG